MDADKFNRTYELLQQRKAIENELESLVPGLIGDHEAGIILELDGKKLRVCQRSILVDDELKTKVSDSMWRTLTKRVTVADLIKGAIARGKLDKDIVNSCRKPSKKWLEKR